MKAHDETCFVYIYAEALLGIDRRGLCTCGADPDAQVDRAKGLGMTEESKNMVKERMERRNKQKALIGDKL